MFAFYQKLRFEKNVIFFNVRFYSSIFLILVYGFNLMAQSEKSTLTQIEKLRTNSDFNSQGSDYIDLLIALAKEKIRTNPDTTALLLKEGYELSIENNYKAGESRALSTFGYFYFEKGDVEKAYDYNMKALKIASTYNLGDEKLEALNNMGIDFSFQGKSAQALTRFLEALAVATEINNTDMMLRINVNISVLYQESGDYETALTFLKIAKNLSAESNNNEILAYTLLNIASNSAEIGDFKEADKALNESIVNFKKENSIDGLSHAYEQKGIVELLKKNYHEALVWLTKSEELCDEIDFKLGYASVYIRLAEAHLGINNLDAAEDYALKGLSTSTELTIAENIKQSNLMLSKIYAKKGQDKLAYKYLSTYSALFKKEATEKFKKGLGILRSELKFENQKKELIEEQDKAIAEQKNYVYLAIAALLIVSLFLISIFRTNKLQKVYTEKLKEKQEILITSEAELSASNNTKDKLFSIIAHDLKGPINSFHNLLEMTTTESMSKDDYDFVIPQALHGIRGISDMLNNLLLWAKTQMQGIVPHQENIDVHKLIKNTVSVLNPMAEKKEINILNTVPINTSSFSDKNHLTIIIRNLLTNAVKFTNQKGEIRISATELPTKLQVSIADDGVGMNKETLAALFKYRRLAINIWHQQ